jgi:hypothetical protein
MCMNVSKFTTKLEKLKFWKKEYIAYKMLVVQASGNIRTPHISRIVSSEIIEADCNPQFDNWNGLRLHGGAIHCYRSRKVQIDQIYPHEYSQFVTVRVIAERKNFIAADFISELAFSKVQIHPEDYAKILKLAEDKRKSWDELYPSSGDKCV